MKINLALFLSIILSVGLVAVGFTFFQIVNERNKMNDELERKIIIAAEDFNNNNRFKGKNPGQLQPKLADNITRKYRLLGIAIYYSNDSITVFKDTIQPIISNSIDFVEQSVTADSAMGQFTNIIGKNLYQYSKPVRNTDSTLSAIVLYSDAGYINQVIRGIWLRNFVRWFIQVLIVTLVTIFIIQWGVFKPINKIILWIKATRHGDIEQLKKNPPVGFLAPLHREIKHMAQAMYEARIIAEEEARLRTTAEAIWTSERLKEEIKKILIDKSLIVISNREPYMHIHDGKQIKYIVPASGMITAIEPILKACGGLWIASGSGDADRETVDKNNCVMVPPEEPKYTLKRVWLTKEEEDHYYYGFSNEGLWPLCHIAHTRPIFRKEDWQHYQKVNKNFAKATLEEIKNQEQPFILVQDYHFALLPKMIKDERPDAKVAIFWHIPWPNPESFGICPWQQEILSGMLGADLIGFHTQYLCNNFLETVNNTIESRVKWDNFSVKIGKQTTFVKPFPISIAFTLKDYDNGENIQTNASGLLENFGIKAKYMGIGVDRIDYTKGLVEKFLAIEKFLDKNPSYQGKFTFIQIGAPSRTLIKNYADLVNTLENEVNRINWRFKMKDWKPILFLKRHHSHEEILPFYKASDFCMVTSLHDGMNLVAKEYVASRNNNDGALILSRFAGASQELQGAIIVNPYDIDKTSDAIKIALELPKDEQQQRMKQMRQTIVGHNIYLWAANLVKAMTSIQG